MQVIPLESVPQTRREHHVRQGDFRFWQLAAGREGDPRNFSLQLVRLKGDFFSPRHRHNFDQVRFQIEGESDFGPDGRMTPGTVGYFPEGTRYGPQTNKDGETLVLVLQFGGASGQGYMTEAQYQRAAEALGREGRFEDGVYTRLREDGQKVNQDGYEAIWEHVNGRRLEYPRSRYDRAVMMHPEAFEWCAAPEAPGVRTRRLGEFSELRTLIAVHAVDAGARLPLDDASLWFVTRGEGSVDGQPVRTHTTIHVDAGERATLAASAPLELLQVRMPAAAVAAASMRAAA